MAIVSLRIYHSRVALLDGGMPVAATERRMRNCGTLYASRMRACIAETTKALKSKWNNLNYAKKQTE
jgi:hypothetical protein